MEWFNAERLLLLIAPLTNLLFKKAIKTPIFSKKRSLIQMK
jgi:hypothetical protein